MKKNNIPKPIFEKLESELLTGEKMLWAGLPGGSGGSNQFFMASFVAGMIALLGVGIVSFGYSGGSLAVVIPMVAIIIAALAGLSIGLKNFSRAQAYAVTNRRAIILHRNSVESFGANDLQSIERKMHRNGTGDIIFRKEYYKRPTMAGTVYVESNSVESIGFLGVENPAELEALILETFQPEEISHNRLSVNEHVKNHASDMYLLDSDRMIKTGNR